MQSTKYSGDVTNVHAKNHLHMISRTRGERVCAYPPGALSCMCEITDHSEAGLKNKTGHIRAQYL